MPTAIGFMPAYLSTREAAAYLNLSPKTLDKQRIVGGGPRYRKLGRRVVYAVVDLDAWADARTRTRTTDALQSAV